MSRAHARTHAHAHVIGPTTDTDSNRRNVEVLLARESILIEIVQVDLFRTCTIDMI